MFLVEPEKVEKAAWALDVTEHVANVGARREYGIDSGDELAIVFETTFAISRLDAVARSRRGDAHHIPAALAVFVRDTG